MEGSLSPLQRWLQFVDGHLSEEAVEYIKLGLYSEFFRYHSEMEKFNKPSELYHFLLHRCLRNSDSKALKMFLHVIRGLGGKLRGNLVISGGFGKGSQFRVKDPGLFEIERAPVNFKFFQCLLKIATKARDMHLGEQLKKKFSKSRFLNANHCHIKNLPELFIRLYQRKFIAANNTHHLIEALSKYKAWVCLSILNSYHKSVFLQPIALAEKMEQKFGPISFSSSDPSSFEESMSDTAATKYWFNEGTELESIDECDPMRFCHVSTVYDPIKPTSVSDDDSDPDTCIIHSSESMLQRKTAATVKFGGGVNKVAVTSRQSKKRSKVLLMSSVIVIVLLLLALILTLLFTVWMHLKPSPLLKKELLNGTSIFLEEIDSNFHKTVVVKLDKDNLTDVYVEFYGSKGSCDNGNFKFLPVTREVYLTEKNISTFTPKYFALKDSVFQYEISGNSTTSPNTIVEVCAYKGVNYSTGVSTCSGKIICCIRCQLGQKCEQYMVSQAGYYYFKVESKEIQDYRLNITETLRTLHINNRGEYLHCNISASNKICHIPLPQGDKYCLMAKFYPSKSLTTVKLDLHVENGRYSIMLATPLSIFVVIMAMCIVCTCICCRKLYSTKNLITIV